MKIIIPFFALLFGFNSIIAQQFNTLADVVIEKDTLKIERLLQSGVDINTQHSTSGTTVLMIASSYYYYDDMVEYLIHNGANVNGAHHTTDMRGPIRGIDCSFSPHSRDCKKERPMRQQCSDSWCVFAVFQEPQKRGCKPVKL